MEIPQEISDYAKCVGFNSIKHIKTIGDSEYYILGLVDKDGNVQPTGLPHVIEYKDGDISKVTGDAMWDLLRLLKIE